MSQHIFFFSKGADSAILSPVLPLCVHSSMHPISINPPYLPLLVTSPDQPPLSYLTYLGHFSRATPQTP
jgi:hypothetical protein